MQTEGLLSETLMLCTSPGPAANQLTVCAGTGRGDADRSQISKETIPIDLVKSEPLGMCMIIGVVD